MRFDRRPSGFTLKELLVLVTVIAIATGLLSVSIRNAHETSRRNECSSNLKQLALAGRLRHAG